MLLESLSSAVVVAKLSLLVMVALLPNTHFRLFFMAKGSAHQILHNRFAILGYSIAVVLTRVDAACTQLGGVRGHALAGVIEDGGGVVSVLLFFFL